MFRFTIRDVLWLMVMVGLTFGWWVDRRTVVATLGAVRVHASELRQELWIARVKYGPQNTLFSTSGGKPEPEVRWELVADPIP